MLNLSREIDEELNRINELLDELERLNPEHKGEAAAFIDQHILNEEAPPIAYKMASFYLEWVLSKGLPKGSFFRSCKCIEGWIEKEDGTVYPCDRCRAEFHHKWWTEEVDEDWMPS